jgi:hypothetical protein
MSHVRKAAFLAAIAILGLIGPPGARGDLTVAGSFGPYGDINILPSSPNVAISYGADGQGSVYQMDGYVNVPGVAFSNPGDPSFGPSADLANGPPTGSTANGVPVSLNYTFSSSQPTADQLLLTYQFTNVSNIALPGFQFLQYTDPDVGSGLGEYATLAGASSLGQPGNPSSFEVSDASSGPTFTNLANGMLSNNNDLPSPTSTSDVSFALGFDVGTLGVGQTATIEVLLSDDGSTLSNFSITEVNPGYPGDGLTISGIIVVPEPRSLVLVAIGSLLALIRTRRTRDSGLRTRDWGSRKAC